MTESDLRKWVRDKFGMGEPRPRWIEPAPGSTVGLPDAFITNGEGAVIWLELKIGTAKNDQLRISLTPEQRREFPRLMAEGQKILFLIGGEKKFLMSADDALIQGYVPTARLPYFMSDAITGEAFLRMARLAAQGS